MPTVTDPANPLLAVALGAAAVLLPLLVTACVVLTVSRARLSRRLAAAEADAAGLRAAAEAAGGLRTLIEASAETLGDRFAALSAEALDVGGRRFLDLADRRLGGTEDAAAARLSALIDPLRSQLDRQAAAVAELERGRRASEGGLKEQLLGLARAQEGLDRRAGELAAALSGSSAQRGRWGELTLRRVAESAGMVDRCDFGEQFHIAADDRRGVLRPDMVVHLPGDRRVVVDAKGVGASYLAACREADEAERERLLGRHLADLETQVKRLSEKAYQRALPRGVDFVVLFVPGDSFLAPAAERRPDLLEWALARNVVIATPTTLVTLLKAVAMGWREQAVSENAARIRDAGAELHRRLQRLTAHLDAAGRGLAEAVTAHNRFLGSFERHALPAARRLEAMDAAGDEPLRAEAPAASTPGPIRSRTPAA
ncbi:DNA recombination protein RmuC [Phycisphaera mikurensis]|uniref:Putative DNA recombination protein n=1 Tax=Phycisphaera mikurensis (strain NBRC 102666 / KCTC 22515 / FYK2301M01) TaxID=1142394 RepID=I0IDE9_PHYMF|nr:DNA recombination protein RmuC [Phycisphaera mikurensis]MBB6443327.1 DNA recombination protein RmuC [Phycisphaera mikurensis]BAM03287.1 putative DNA recombination protein [Phycisphaera mikurensis NBRC 102666]